MFGRIELENFNGLTKMPQEAASAWSVMDNLTGASYKPLLYVGRQITHGINYYFIAEQTLIINPPLRRLTRVVIEEYNGEYLLLDVEAII